MHRDIKDQIFKIQEVDIDNTFFKRLVIRVEKGCKML